MSTPMLSVDTTDTDMPVTTLARDLLRPPLTLMPMPTMVTTAYLPTLTATDTVSDTADTVTVTVMLTTVKHYPTSNLIHNHLYYPTAFIQLFMNYKAACAQQWFLRRSNRWQICSVPSACNSCRLSCRNF